MHRQAAQVDRLEAGVEAKRPGSHSCSGMEIDTRRQEAEFGTNPQRRIVNIEFANAVYGLQQRLQDGK